ncbi:TetR/AcrR family transcriptional regulator [Vitiosangium sp. GDMCC 1.1324]|uniref:TetR/AcrR family transcriptional regulator n=1 Tax=Vitiosangium sp. (strain GDMCC 1.1324) TaxID=2138576 RepID=UPI000D3790E4|nr:TetR/AcrR family transcriptional regulator [Vitiosangium sp. GDMCC 1.1324]PTL77119.1 TetR family transcriptional regulator [Vitiosangium sp. GDMCC 1.1324]
MGKREQTHQRILDAAVRVASREGLEALTIGRLADETEMSKGGLFAHFGSKESLQIEVLGYTSEAFHTTVVQPALQLEPGLPRLRKLFERWLSWLSRPEVPGGCILLSASSEVDDCPGPVRDAVVAQMRSLLLLVVKFARQAQEQKQIRAELDVHRLAFSIQGLLLSFHHSHRLLRNPRAYEHARAAFDELLAPVMT